MLAAVIQFENDNADAFVMLTGISDSRGFNELPSWGQPAFVEDRCYVGAQLLSCTAFALLCQAAVAIRVRM